MPGKMKIITLSALAESLSTLIYTTAAFDLKKKLFLKQGLIPKKVFYYLYHLSPRLLSGRSKTAQAHKNIVWPASLVFDCLAKSTFSGMNKKM